jgi:hypothetical protein
MTKLQVTQSKNDALKIVKNELEMWKLQPTQSRDDALKIVKNGLEMRKLQLTQSRDDQKNSPQKKITERYNV